ncbi:MinD/ParA family protein [Thermosulfuriphilus sp.]
MILSVTSGKGGVGKTSLVVNMAKAIADSGGRVLVVDCDLGLANVDILLELAPSKNIQHVIMEGEPIEEIVISVPQGFDVLPASSGVAELTRLDNEAKEHLLEHLQGLWSRYQWVLFDTGAGIGDTVIWFNSLAHRVVVIITPEPTSLTDAYALIKVLHRHQGRKDFWIVINEASGRREGQRLFEQISRVVDRFLAVRVHLLGVIPRDKNLFQAVREQRLLLEGWPLSPASQAIRDIASIVFSWPSRLGRSRTKA